MTKKKNNRLSSSTLGEMGEWGFLNKILPRISSQKPERFLVGPGDDAAILKTSSRTVLSIDGLVDGTHFDLKWAPGFAHRFGFSMGRGLGWKLMGSCLSDLAAMGWTQKRWAILFLGASSNTHSGFLLEIFSGAKEMARRFDCVLAGGDTVKSKVLTLSAAVGAEWKGRKPLTRRGGNPGELLCIAGQVGDSVTGLSILKGKNLSMSLKERKYFVEKFFKHTPMLKIGEILQKENRVTALMDLSDPLDQSLCILSKASGVGCDVNLDSVPRSNVFRKIAGKPKFAEMGGEDYSLLFTLKKQGLPSLRQQMKFAVIGETRGAAQGVRFFRNGRPFNPRISSFRHFK